MVTWYLYPWDVLGDPSAVARLAGLGVRRVALAAAYHSVRAATPRHPAHRVVDAAHAACYVPVRAAAWRGSTLTPVAPGGWAAPDAFPRARERLGAAGIAVDAWVVLTHHTLLGSRHPGLVVRNAFGDRYDYALCPANPAVRDYSARLVREVLAQGAPDGVVLEAYGQLGAGHQSHHDKTSGADWSTVDEALLSICCCVACRSGQAAAGLDPDAVAAAVRAAVGRGHGTVEAVLGDTAAAVLGVRTSAVDAMRAAVTPDRPAAWHATADPWATGPGAPLPAGPADPAGSHDTFVIGCWGPAAAGTAALRAAGPDRRLGAYVSMLPPSAAGAADVGAGWPELVAAGAGELHLYHAGLASDARLRAAAAAVTAVSPATSERP